MNPFLLLPIGIALAKIIFDSSESSEISTISRENIYGDFLKEDERMEKRPYLKASITKNINYIISNVKKFKLGKTGHPNNRSQKHLQKYTCMYLLCQSKDANFISELEAYYNEKYFDIPGNQNKKTGSAAQCKSPNGNFYLYLITK